MPFGDLSYRLVAQDGYVTGLAPTRWRREPPWNGMAYEAGMAEHVFRLRTKQEGGHILHIWVLGMPGWTKNLPESLRSLWGFDEAANYRVLIEAGSWRAGEHPHRGLTACTRNCGMTAIKRHENSAEYRSRVRPLLAAMYDSYKRTGETPNGVLLRTGIAFASRSHDVSGVRPHNWEINCDASL